MLAPAQTYASSESLAVGERPSGVPAHPLPVGCICALGRAGSGKQDQFRPGATASRSETRWHGAVKAKCLGATLKLTPHRAHEEDCSKPMDPITRGLQGLDRYVASPISPDTEGVESCVLPQ